MIDGPNDAGQNSEACDRLSSVQYGDCCVLLGVLEFCPVAHNGRFDGLYPTRFLPCGPLEVTATPESATPMRPIIDVPRCSVAGQVADRCWWKRSCRSGHRCDGRYYETWSAAKWSAGGGASLIDPAFKQLPCNGTAAISDSVFGQ